MGAASVKGMVMMETIYPSKDGVTIFEDPKLKQRLVKEMKKGNIKPPSMSDSLDIDEDMDVVVDGIAAEVWRYYDPKNTGLMKKTAIQAFFKDCLDLYAMRARKDTKMMLAPGVTMSAAMEVAVRGLDQSGQGIRERDFIDYLNECDMEEILAPFLGTQGQVNINSRLPQSMMFDPSILSASDFQARAPVKLRDYGQD